MGEGVAKVCVELEDNIRREGKFVVR